MVKVLILYLHIKHLNLGLSIYLFFATHHYYNVKPNNFRLFKDILRLQQTIEST